MLENADEEEDIHLGIVKSGKTAELEIFVHTAGDLSVFSNWSCGYLLSRPCYFLWQL